MLKEFKEFVSKGSVLDMAVGIIIGGALTAMVKSLVDDILNPLIGMFLGGVDFAGLKASVGDASFTYGNFIMAIINFLIISFVIFMIVRAVNNMKKKEEEVAEEPAGPTDNELLSDILAALKK